MSKFGSNSTSSTADILVDLDFNASIGKNQIDTRHVIGEAPLDEDGLACSLNFNPMENL